MYYLHIRVPGPFAAAGRPASSLPTCSTDHWVCLLQYGRRGAIQNLLTLVPALDKTARLRIAYAKQRLNAYLAQKLRRRSLANDFFLIGSVVPCNKGQAGRNRTSPERRMPPFCKDFRPRPGCTWMLRPSPHNSLCGPHISKAVGVAATRRFHSALNAVEAETSAWCTPCFLQTSRVMRRMVS